jgi:hypothetical protein
MDEHKPRRRWLSFGIRDLLWAMVVVGLAVGWWLDHRHLSAQCAESTERTIEAVKDTVEAIERGRKFRENR